MNLDDQFDRLCHDTTSDIYEFLPIFYREVGMANSAVPVIIELGVRAGVSTIAWLFGIERFGGHLFSVDGAPPCLDTDGSDLLGQYMNEKRDLSVRPFWTFIKGWDNEQWVLDSLPAAAHIIFVDTNHTYEMTMDELETYYPRVIPGGCMLFHDTNIVETGNASTPQPPYPVKTAVQEFASAHNLTATFIDERCGLGRIFKP